MSPRLWLLFVSVVLTVFEEGVSLECLNVDTSEGPVILQHGQWACAPLLDGETKEVDLGKRFITCSNGHVLMQSCPGVLRFHVPGGICLWQQFRDCNLPGLVTNAMEITKSITPTTSKTTKQYTHAVSTENSTQGTSNVPNQQTTPQVETQTEYSSKFSLETTQKTYNLSTGIYTTSGPVNTQTSTKIKNSTKDPIYSTTRRVVTSQSTNRPATTKISIYSTTRRVVTSQSTNRPTTTKISIYSTTQRDSNAQTSTEILYTSPNKSATQVTKASSTSAASTLRSTTIPKTTALPVTPNTDFKSQASTRASSTGYSTTSLPRTSTLSHENSSDQNPDTTTTDPPDYVDPCKWETCQLPQCFCYGARPNISLQDTPMFLLLTFDGPISQELYSKYYEQLLVDNSNRLFNQNGCSFRSTVFLTGTGSDYNAVQTLASSGHEIASGTLSDTLPQGNSDADYKNMVNEIDGLRDRVLEETKNQNLHDSILGFRAPSLKTGKDVQFRVLKDNNFLYDSSISNIEIYSARDPVWPYTLDFGVVQCPAPPCPSKNYSGVWEIPLNSWLGGDGQSCSYPESCNVGDSFFAAEENDWYNLFKKNFETYFYPVKAPMHIAMRASTPIDNQPFEQALIRWLNDILVQYNDVWLVTHKMVIDWVRGPKTNSQMIAQKWGC